MTIVWWQGLLLAIWWFSSIYHITKKSKEKTFNSGIDLGILVAVEYLGSDEDPNKIREDFFNYINSKD